MDQTLIQRAAMYVKARLAGETTGHDWFHIERVWKMSKKLQAEEGGDLFLIELAALLHDLGDDPVFEFNVVKGSLILTGMMDVLEIEEAVKEKIVEIVHEVQYQGPLTAAPTSLESKILRDADWLDDLGALGIARVFATGGHIGRILHDPSRPLRPALTYDMNRKTKKQGTSLNYFYEKMLNLPELMCTKTGKVIAQKRADFIREFIKVFLREWDGAE